MKIIHLNIQNHYLVLIICTIFLILPSFQSFSQETPILAVTDIFVNKRIESELSLPLTDRIREIFVNSNQYQVIDRNTINLVIEEQKFQLSGLVDAERTVKIGKLLGAQFIVAGNLTKIENLNTMSLRIIDVETGVIVSQVSGETEGGLNVLLQLAEKLGNKIVGVKPISEKIGSIYVSSNMKDSDVLLDGIRKGETPLLIEDVQKGYHLLEVKKDYYYYKAEVAVMNRDIIEVDAILEILKGNIFIQTDPDKVNIFIDKKGYGQTPKLIKNIISGEHELILVKDWYMKVEDSFEVLPYETTRIQIDLVQVGELFIDILDNEHEVNNITVKKDGVGEDIFLLDLLQRGMINELPVGRYILKVDGTNIKKTEGEIYITGGKTLTVQITPEYTEEYITKQEAAEKERIEKEKAMEREKEKNALMANIEKLKLRRVNYKTAGFVFGGGAAAFTGGTLLFYFLSRNQMDEYNTYYDLYKQETDTAKAVEYRNTAQDHMDQSRSLSTVEYVFLGSAILSAGISVYLFIRRPKEEDINRLEMQISTYSHDDFRIQTNLIKRF
ncbi:hypothetical protein ES703_34424 [subsurface metagenome]